MSARLDHDRLRVGAALAGLSGLAWVYVAFLATRMHTAMMTTQAMGDGMAIQPSAAPDALVLFVMWAVMMVAMMLPSAAPMISMFATISRQRSVWGGPLPAIVLFVAGYLVVWTGYSAVAALAQAALHRGALLSATMASTSRLFGAILLGAAGVFQWTPLKRTCLRRCRSPLGFVLTEWRPGRRGALVMGIRHGTFCLGCCWALMALLFVAGVMNLVWIAALSAFILLEKLIPRGEAVARVAGALLVAAAVTLAVSG